MKSISNPSGHNIWEVEESLDENFSHIPVSGCMLIIRVEISCILCHMAHAEIKKKKSLVLEEFDIASDVLLMTIYFSYITFLFETAGLHVLSSESVEIPWFDSVFADIGDEQSLSQSLSTFSGHLKQISVRMICFPDFFFVCFC
jgi:hypothetical protein